MLHPRYDVAMGTDRDVHAPIRLKNYEEESSMARLPNVDLAVLDVRKLSDYCLDSAHRRGRNKARVFRAALGITREDAGWLKAAILDALPNAPAFEDDADEYGSRGVSISASGDRAGKPW